MHHDTAVLLKCQQCKKIFPDEGELRNHMQNKHYASLTCQQCEVRYPKEANLINHMQNKHVEK